MVLSLCASACQPPPPAATGQDAGGAGAPHDLLNREQLMDPQQCRGCHPQHYREWASSMHAYAASDPVLLAMNRRGQRETDGQLGVFCVRCHAPMALHEDATDNGENLDELPDMLKGVTCYFCHTASAVRGHDNNGIELADDTTMRAAIRDPIPSPAHGVRYSALLDRNRHESAELCGSCHDVVTPTGVRMERTFAEYKRSLFGQLSEGFETCNGCHMPGHEGRAAEAPGAPERVVHDHLWPGVDVALSPFPDRDLQHRAIECELSLNTRIRALDHDGLGTFTVQTETAAGHRQPSGAAQDRRMWLEVIAYDNDDEVIFASGRIGDQEPVDKETSDPRHDPQLALYRDWIYDAAGQPTHHFWEVAPSDEHPDGYEALTLPFATDPGLPHTVSARYRIPRHREIARMTVRMRMRPIGIDVLQDLIDSGDLDPKTLDRVPTFTLHGAAVEWRPGLAEPRSLLPEELTCPGH